MAANKKSTIQFKSMPINLISIQDGFNPRVYFSDGEMQELIASIKSEGVLQPIVVRPQPDNKTYWVVAGERRYRAAVAAGLSEIPAVVRHLDDKQARLVATIENTQRADMSPGEEAIAARNVLSDCDGDRAEALRLLGWSAKKFEARLLLLHASTEVLNALTARAIRLGHAELLCQLPSDFQNATLEKLIEHQYSVPELKARLSRFARPLESAIFDRTECASCHHNSYLQANLFDEHVESGLCANPDCFNQKTQDAVEARKCDLHDRYAAVFLDTEKPPQSFVVVIQTGQNGVGKTQFEKGCSQCRHFGALLSTNPNSPGKVSEDCCFDLDCHGQKVRGYQASLSNPGSSTMTGNTVTATGADAKKGANPGRADSAHKPSDGTSGATPGKVLEHIEGFFRDTGAKYIVQHRHGKLLVNSYALYRLVQTTFPKEALPIAAGTKQASWPMFGTLRDFVDAFGYLSIEEMMAFNERILTHLLGQHERINTTMSKAWAMGSAGVCKFMDIALQDEFIVTREFLSAFTKSGMEGLLREAINGKGVAFVTYFEGINEKNTFANLMKKKNGEILDEVFGCGYDFAGFVPACVIQFMGEDKPVSDPNSTHTAATTSSALALSATNSIPESGWFDDDDDERIANQYYTLDPELEV
ncbi:PRTRC system ParB family protein [Methylomonas sp. SURF-1]|uniref:PRTRC system ParB family protein n=1 Tax=Methylomonas aurea TaxID=2952224 RepID=A0ABT1ULW1_9GAMM|nr:PRTRC system ParB family protein [Methylomonas sp. SURF-1]MCQ8183217.1 PRTRC system ParB family protein [Methylomonas sp. SURF-1]